MRSSLQALAAGICFGVFYTVVLSLWKRTVQQPEPVSPSAPELQAQDVEVPPATTPLPGPYDMESFCPCATEADSRIPLVGQEEDAVTRWNRVARFVAEESSLDERQDPRVANLQQAIAEHETACLFCKAKENLPIPTAARRLKGIVFLADDYDIVSAQGVSRFISEPRDTRRLMQLTPPAGFFGSVVHDGTRFIMFYRARRPARIDTGTKREKLPGRVKVSFSSDGMIWTKSNRTYGLDNFGGGVEHCVLYDRDEARAISSVQDDVQLPAATKPKPGTTVLKGDVRDVICFASSEDGVHWVDRGQKVEEGVYVGDTQNCLHYDPSRDQYQMTTRLNFPAHESHRAIRGSAVLRVSRRDFIAAINGDAMIPFQQVVAWDLTRFGTKERYRRQMYAMSRTEYKDIYFGIALVYDWPISELGCIDASRLTCNLRQQAKLTSRIRRPDTIQPYLTTSRNGAQFNFQWVYAESPLKLGAHPEDGIVIPASEILTVGGYHHIFYSRSLARHRGRWGFPEEIRLARFEANRMVGLQPTHIDVDGKIIVRPFQFKQHTSKLCFSVYIPQGSSFDVALRLPSVSIPLASWSGPAETV
eukprot:CAMPEP_0178372810 /NCGR_PEP_ID=MMETSP0689_2-20121128/1545_1 /TAXON_ID=160604 /ORGANISM="Amphidinium massartii, Strain CS-259" /LENGTH=588 /DNA_ID=CAMNT_0019992745 /DNA_START=144 /DNA_END=1908 /DNA_ORIENTATION=-